MSDVEKRVSASFVLA